MRNVKLRPPLPPPLSHEGIAFVSTPAHDPQRLSPQTLVAIALALGELLPSGDFVSTADGKLYQQDVAPQSPWVTAARLESVERSPS